MEQIANMGRVFARDAQLLAHGAMVILRQRFRCFDAKPMQIKILGVLTALKQSLGLDGSPSPYGHQGQAERIHLPGGLGREEVCDTKLPAFPLTRKCEPEQFSPLM